MIDKVRELLSKFVKKRAAKSEQSAKGSGFTRWHAIAAVFVVIAVSLLVILIALPWVFTGSPRLWELSDYVQPDEPADKVALVVAQIQASVAFVQLLGGVLLISVLYTGYQTMRHTQEGLELTRAQLQVSRDELVVAREGQLTERFTRAIELLGSTDEQGRKRVEVRLGGIYALERIARDSDKDHETIMELLTAYVRENAPAPSEQASTFMESLTFHPAPDIQAILAVIGRRLERQRHLETLRLNLSGTDLRRANLRNARLNGANLEGANLGVADLNGAHLEGGLLTGAYLTMADLSGSRLEGARLLFAHLEGAGLSDAHLEGAILCNAHLEEAVLLDAHLEGADLAGAHLEGAHLAGAYLEGANFLYTNLEGADLKGAHLEGTDLSQAFNLTQEQIDYTYMDDQTRLPDAPASDGQPYPRSTQRIADEEPSQ